MVYDDNVNFPFKLPIFRRAGVCSIYIHILSFKWIHVLTVWSLIKINQTFLKVIFWIHNGIGLLAVKKKRQICFILQCVKETASPQAYPEQNVWKKIIIRPEVCFWNMPWWKLVLVSWYKNNLFISWAWYFSRTFLKIEYKCFCIT